MSRTGFLKRIPVPAVLKRFQREESGLAMVEFAIALPALTAMWLGTVTFADLQRVSNNTSKIAATVSDIVAQGTTIDETGAKSAFAIVDTLFGNQPRDAVSLYVAGLKLDKKKRPVVVWTYGYKDTKLPEVGSFYNVDGRSAVQVYDDFLVVAHATVIHKTIFTHVISADQVYDYSSYNYPRSGDPIEAVD